MILKDLLDDNIKKFGEYAFLYYNGKSISNVETRNYADQLANGLLELGIKKDDKVIVCLPNCPEVIISYQGITRAGAITVPVMYMLHPNEIYYIAKNSSAKAIITSSHLLNNVEKAIEGLLPKPLIIAIDIPGNERVFNFYEIMNSSSDKRHVQPNSIREDDIAIILFTSGTTGNPKGVILTHKNLYTNVINSVKHHNSDERTTTIGVLPLAHLYGLQMANTCYVTGSSIVIFSKFEPERIFEAIEKYKVKSFAAVPAMIHALYHFPDSDKYDLSSLETVGSGSAPLPVALIYGFQKKFNVQILEGYGLTETAPAVATHVRGKPIKPGSVGIPLPGVEIKIVDDDGNEVPVGEAGELLVRGENVTPGYFRNEEETRKAIKNGWFHTGDIAKLDEDGYLFIVDRKKDIIIRGGFNLYPRDVEEIIAKHPGVMEVAVVGVPDEKMGEEMIACVVKKPGMEVAEEDIIGLCQEHLTKRKTPKRVLFIEQLPRNSVGKILKRHLRTIAEDMLAKQ